MQNKAARNQRKTDSAREQTKGRIYADIVSKILAAELGVGQRLKEQDLAQTHKVSRTPIREILIALERDGLVERIRNRGAEVISFTPDDVEQLYDIRGSLECLAVRHAITHMPLNDLLSFEQRFEALDGRQGPRGQRQQPKLDFELHRFIVSQSRNRRLVKYFENISLLPHFGLSLRSVAPHYDKYVRDLGQEHLTIVRALLHRDSELAERLLAEHIESSKHRMLELLYQRRETVKQGSAKLSFNSAVL